MRVPIGVIKEGERNSEYWISLVGSQRTELLRAPVAIDSQNNIYNSGGSFQSIGILFKMNKLGDVQFFAETKISDSTFESNTNVSIDSSGFVYSGSDGSTGFQTRKYVTKYNASFAIQWQRIFSISTLLGVYADSQDSVFVFGQDQPDPSKSWYTRAYLAKLNSSGSLLWQRVLGDNPPISNDGYEEFYGYRSVVTDSQNNVYAAGFANFSNSSGLSTAFIVKYNSSGVLQWKKRFDATDLLESAQGQGLAIDSQDNLYFTIDKTVNPGATQFNVGIVVKLNSSGDILWQRALAGNISSSAGKPFADDSSIYVPQLSAGQGIISKVNFLGQVIYQRKVEEPGQSLADFQVAVAENETMYLNAHRTGSPIYPNQDYLQISLPSSGSLYGSYKIGVAPINISLYEAVPIVSDIMERPLLSNSGTPSISVTTPSAQTVTSLTSQNNKIIL